MYAFNWALTAFRSESYIGSATALPDSVCSCAVSACCALLLFFSSIHMCIRLFESRMIILHDLFLKGICV